MDLYEPLKYLLAHDQCPKARKFKARLTTPRALIHKLLMVWTNLFLHPNV